MCDEKRLLAPGDPSGIRKAEGAQSPLPLVRSPAPPRELSKEARKIWRRLVPVLVAWRRLTALDLDQVAIYCDALVKLRSAADMMDIGLLLPGRRDDFRTSPVWKIYRDLLATCRSLAIELGLTPGARARLGLSDMTDAGDPSESGDLPVPPGGDEHP